MAQPPDQAPEGGGLTDDQEHPVLDMIHKGEMLIRSYEREINREIDLLIELRQVLKLIHTSKQRLIEQDNEEVLQK